MVMTSPDESSDSLFVKNAHKFGSSPPVSSKLKALFSDDDPTDGLFGVDPRDKAPVVTPSTSSTSSSTSAVAAALFGADEDPLFGLVGKAKVIPRSTGGRAAGPL
jgi:hypothetical protein